MLRTDVEEIKAPSAQLARAASYTGVGCEFLHKSCYAEMLKQRYMLRLLEKFENYK